MIIRFISATLLSLLAAGCAADRFPSPEEPAAEMDRPFADSTIQISVEGNDGPAPGDVLYVGQTSRLIGSALAVGRAPDGEYRGLAREVRGAHLVWRSTAPEVLEVDSSGRVRALRAGSARIIVSAYLSGSAPTALASDSMPFRVLPTSSALRGPPFMEVSTAATADGEQTCGILTAGEVACLRPVDVRGSGEGESSPLLQVFAPPVRAGFRGVVTGMRHVCALGSSDGRAYCWGANEHGQVGRAGPAMADVPTPVAAEARFRKLATGRGHTCGLTTDHQVLCWGLGMNGALGPAGVDRCPIMVERQPHHAEPVQVPCARVPRPVALPEPAVDIAVGDEHACALGQTGAPHCWGHIYNIDFTSRGPRRIDVGAARLVRIESGSRHVCGLDAQGRAYCWGRNWNGQISNSVSKEGSRAFVRVPGLPALREISGGDDHTCAISTTDEAFCWGRNINGQLGGGVPLEDRLTRVSGPHRWRSIAAGYAHTCGITNAGALYCWGSGLAFRREPGSFHEQPEPFPISGWRQPVP